jgi:hypothetical protein
MQKYCSEYAVKYPGVIRKSQMDEYHAFCTVCNDDFSVTHGGIGDIERHVKTTKHTTRTGQGGPSVCKVSDFFTGSKDLALIRAESLFTDFIIEHNLPIACADHAGSLFKRMFPDSSIASKYGCGRTKTSCIVETLASDDSQRIMKAMQNQPYSLATDGSNDIGAVKLYPVCVRYFDDEIGRVLCVMLSLKECNQASTGENIFKALDEELTQLKIPWQNCISFAADNASVMTGKSKGVAAFRVEQIPSVYLLGCACHLMHLSASKAASAMSVQVDELLTDVYFYLDKSRKRMQELKRFQSLHDLDVHKILKHVSVRWLSIGICLSRLLEQWPALSDLFESETKSQRSTNPLPVRAKVNTSSSGHKSSSVKSTVRTSTHGSGPSTAVKTSSSSSSGHKSSSVKSTVRTSTHGSGPSTAVKTRSSSSSGHKSSSVTVNTSGCGEHVAKITTSSPTSTSTVHATSASSHDCADFDLTKFLFKEANVAASAAKAKAQQNEKDRAEKKVYTYDASDSRVMRVNRLLQDPYTKLVCLFLQSSVVLFDNANRILQREDPCIHLLNGVLLEQLKNIFIRFVKPALVAETADIMQIPYQQQINQKKDEDIAVGAATAEYIETHKKELEPRLPQFYREVRMYYTVACDYMLKKFPYNDPLLVNAEVPDISKRCQHSFRQIKFFTDRFKCIMPNSCTLDGLEQEFLRYQVDNFPDTITKSDRIDTAWHNISQVRDPATGQAKYASLSTVMKGILVIFHSNADCERIFSLLTKNKTDYRSNLSNKTVGSLITRKMMMSAKSTVCHAAEYSNQLLTRAKSATYAHHQATAGSSGDGDTKKLH